jgi:HlyD family secretion protein
MLNLLRNKNFRIWGFGAIVVVALVWLGINFSSANAGTSTANTEGKVVSLEVASTIEASGSLEAQPFAALDWKTGGVVETVNVKPGDFVNAGDVLLELQPSSTSASIVSAQADLVTAQKNLEDLLTSNTDFAQAVIDLKDAQEKYNDAADYLTYLQNEKKIPQTETRSYLQQTPRGYQYVYKTKSFKGPATEDMLTDAENDLALKKAKLEDAQREYDFSLETIHRM